jgi:hypothetical protein
MTYAVPIGAHIAFGHGEKQALVARAAVHALTVACPARKSFTPRREISRPAHAERHGGLSPGEALFPGVAVRNDHAWCYRAG